MLSRRNVRVKVMQQLYSLAQDRDLNSRDAVNAYYSTIQDSFRLYLLNLYCIIKVCSFAAEDSKNRITKHIKTDEDKLFTDKIFSNPLITSLVNNKVLQAKFKEEKCGEGLDEDLFRKIYKEFCKEEAYQKYLSSESTNEDHVEILLELYRFCRKNQSKSRKKDKRGIRRGFSITSNPEAGPSLTLKRLYQVLFCLQCQLCFQKNIEFYELRH